MTAERQIRRRTNREIVRSERIMKTETVVRMKIMAGMKITEDAGETTDAIVRYRNKRKHRLQSESADDAFSLFFIIKSDILICIELQDF